MALSDAGGVATARAAAERLIVLAAGTRARREAERERAARAARAADWAWTARMLAERRLLPTLGPRLWDLSAGAAGADFLDATTAAIAATRRQETLLRAVSGRLCAALADAGIRHAVVKGPQLGDVLYGEPGRRPSSDVDALVPRADLFAAVEVARGLGYAVPAEPEFRAAALPRLHFSLVHAKGMLPPVELHWRIHWYEEKFAERLLPPAGAARDWRPEAADELAALLLFYARDGLLGLRYPTDIAAWWDRRGAALGTAGPATVAARHPALRSALAAAAGAAERITGAPLATLAPAAPASLRRRAALRLARPLPHSGGVQVYAEMGLVDGLLAPPGGLGQFLERQFRAPTRQRRGAGAWPGAGVLHGAGKLGRYARALAAPRTF